MKSLWGQLGRFAIAGGGNTLVTAVALSLLATLIPWAVAYAIVFALGLVLSTYLAGTFVFKSRFTRARVVRYVALYLVAFLAGLVALALASRWGLPSWASGSVVLVTAPVSFVGGRIIFPHQPGGGHIDQPSEETGDERPVHS